MMPQSQNVVPPIINPDETITLIDWDPRFAADFARLNFAWIERFFKVEPADRQVLENPQEAIIDRGGYVFFAQDTQMGRIIGTSALLRLADTRYELAKMAVDPDYQGRQIGKRLALRAIDCCRNLGAKTLVLETNSGLETAQQLYRRLGFVTVPFLEGGSEHYARADVRMQLDL